MEELYAQMEKIKNLISIRTIVCNDCKEYHHIGREFFKVVEISDENLDMIINNIEDNFKEVHCNHNIEIKEMCPFPIGYKTFIIPFDWELPSIPIQLHYGDNWDLDSSEFDELKDDKRGEKNE